MSNFRLWLGFLAMCVGVFMAVLDIQVVASALTTIGAALNIAPEKLGWVQTGYLMAEVIAIPLTGLLTRALSLRWMFVMAILGFTLASLGCAFSSTIVMLIVLRAVQGFFRRYADPRRLYFHLCGDAGQPAHSGHHPAGLFAVIAPTIGPFVGGYLTTNYSWHWIFLVNVGPGLLVALLVATCIRFGEADLRVLKKIDYGTFVLAAIFLGSLELLLSEAPGRDWHGRFVFFTAILCAISGATRIVARPAPCPAIRGSALFSPPQLRAGLRPVFHLRHGAVRLGLYAGDFSGTGARSHPAGDRRDHDGVGRGPAGDGAGGRPAGKIHGCPSSHRHRLSGVRSGPGAEWVGDAAKRFLGSVLAAGPARPGGDGVYPACHPPGAGRLVRDGCPRCQRAVQSDPQFGAAPSASP